jgi:hypothetical protein
MRFPRNGDTEFFIDGGSNGEAEKQASAFSSRSDLADRPNED